MPRLFGTDGVRGLANREVTADDRDGTAPGGAAPVCDSALAQNDCCRLGKAECEVDRELAIGEPANAVRAEEPRHFCCSLRGAN